MNDGGSLPPTAPANADAGQDDAKARERLRQVRQILAGEGDVLVYVLSGAGLSATAGLRTYRGPQGMYTTGELPPLHAANAVPDRVHIVWEHLHGIVRDAADAASRPPSPAYQALADFQQYLFAAGSRRYLIVGTQNIDGLHQHAGLRYVLELHGSVQRAVCLDERCLAVAPTLELEHDRAAVPRCASCAGPTRPDVVLFGESPYRMDQAMWAAASADVVLAIGTSLQVWPAAGTVAQALGGDAPGLWLDAEPDRARRELPDAARPYFRSLAPVPGDLNTTLPVVIGALMARPAGGEG